MAKKRVSLEFILTSVNLAWHGWLFRDIHFLSSLELEANNRLKPTIAQRFKNPINNF